MLAKYLKQLRKTKWYHGTTLAAWKEICINKINIEHNIGNELDFGYGFYLTQNEEQAKKYIDNIIKYKNKEFSDFEELELDLDMDIDNFTSVVIEFEFNPEQYYKQEEINFGIFNEYNEEFANFVLHNRIENVHGKSQHSYDLIYGVMSDSLPMIIIPDFKKGIKTREEVINALMKSTRDTQLSIHNQDICDKLKVTRAYLVNEQEELSIR